MSLTIYSWVNYFGDEENQGAVGGTGEIRVKPPEGVTTRITTRR